MPKRLRDHRAHLVLDRDIRRRDDVAIAFGAHDRVTLVLGCKRERVPRSFYRDTRFATELM
jgi:hypothetical protein